MSLVAVYSCWRGHSTKVQAQDREKVKGEVPCSTCQELAPLGTVLDAPPRLRVIEGGKE